MKILTNTNKKPLFNTNTNKLLIKPSYASLWLFDSYCNLLSARDCLRDLTGVTIDSNRTKILVCGDRNYGRNTTLTDGSLVLIDHDDSNFDSVQGIPDNSASVIKLAVIDYDGTDYYLSSYQISSNTIQKNWTVNIGTQIMYLAGVDGSGNIIIWNFDKVLSYDNSGNLNWSHDQYEHQYAAVNQNGTVAFGTVEYFTSDWDITFYSWRFHVHNSDGTERWVIKETDYASNGKPYFISIAFDSDDNTARVVKRQSWENLIYTDSAGTDVWSHGSSRTGRACFDSNGDVFVCQGIMNSSYDDLWGMSKRSKVDGALIWEQYDNKWSTKQYDNPKYVSVIDCVVADKGEDGVLLVAWDASTGSRRFSKYISGGGSNSSTPKWLFDSSGNIVVGTSRQSIGEVQDVLI